MLDEDHPLLTKKMQGAIALVALTTGLGVALMSFHLLIPGIAIAMLGFVGILWIYSDDFLKLRLAAEFRQAMRNLASGVAIVATGTDDARRGLTVSSVTSLCMEPPCLLVGINTNSAAHDGILTNGSFGVSLLGSDQEDLALRFAGRDGMKGVQRFQAVPWMESMLSVPILQTAICSFECILHHHQVVGTHGLFVGRIVATRSAEGSPLVNFQGALRSLPQG